jgi:C4-dicarboxylate-specific signal transduction histidine kinase
MKCFAWILTALLTTGLLVGGCSKKSSVDTSKLEQSFASADTSTKSQADKIVSSIKANDYPPAMAELQKLASNLKLTPEQKQAINDVLAQLQKALAETANKAVGEANKALGDMQKSVPK